MRWFLVVAGLLAAVGFACKGSGSGGSGDTPASQLMELINQERANQGAQQLREASGLSAESQWWANEHTKGPWFNWHDRQVEDPNYQDSMAAAIGQTTVTACDQVGLVSTTASNAQLAFNELMSSYSATLMDPNWEMAGIGFTKFMNNNQPYFVWIVDLVDP